MELVLLRYGMYDPGPIEPVQKQLLFQLASAPVQSIKQTNQTIMELDLEAEELRNWSQSGTFFSAGAWSGSGSSDFYFSEQVLIAGSKIMFRICP